MFSLPEFHENRVITWKTHLTTDESLGKYDMILGRDALLELGIDLKFSSCTIEWNTAEVPMHRAQCTVEDSFFIKEEEGSAVREASDRITQIIDAKYEKADLHQIVQAQKQLNQNEQHQLLQLLQKYEELFDGTLGKWKGSPYNIELKPNVTPFHGAPYSIPQAYENTLRHDVEHLEKAGVLKKVN